MRKALIADAVRTPAGRSNGALRNWHPVDLLAYTLRALVTRTGVDPKAIDDVIAGCVSQVGEQALNVARSAWLAAGFPESVPGTTVDRQCGSSQQAIAFAAQGVASGAYDAVVACGVESMSRVALGASFTNGPGERFGPLFAARYAGETFEQGIAAEGLADAWDLTRNELDAYSLESHRRAARATDEGRFDAHLVPVGGIGRDEGIRPDTSAERLAELAPAFRSGGTITAGNASQLSDGAAALLLCSKRFARRHALRPLARIVANTVVGGDPVRMLVSPAQATRGVLARSGLRLKDIDLFEINEAFASVVLVWQKETGADLERVNVNGGAIALGHPLGATGARLMTILCGELVRRRRRYGLQVMCEGGGMANATIVERC